MTTKSKDIRATHAGLRNKPNNSWRQTQQPTIYPTADPTAVYPATRVVKSTLDAVVPWVLSDLQHDRQWRERMPSTVDNLHSARVAVIGSSETIDFVVPSFDHFALSLSKVMVTCMYSHAQK